MLIRETIWKTVERGPVQVSIALLDNAWEAQSEATLAVGPFDELADVRDAALALAWDLVPRGVQDSLF